MCIRRKKRNKKNQMPIRKKKHSCKRRCRRWLFRKIKRCLKKQVFGDPDPKLADYEFIGMNLGSIRDKLRGHKSQTSLDKKAIENKIKLSKINNRDLEQIRALNVTDLKKRYSITGSKLKLLGGMVADYKEGQLSLSEMPGRFTKKKKLDKERLNQMLTDYDTAKKKRDLEEVQKNAEDLKKKLVKSKSKRRILDKIIEDLNKGTLSKAEFFKDKLDPKKMNKEQVNKLLEQYGDAQKLNRGISFMISKKKLSFIPSRVRLHELFEDLKGIRLSEILSTLKR